MKGRFKKPLKTVFVFSAILIGLVLSVQIVAADWAGNDTSGDGITPVYRTDLQNNNECETLGFAYAFKVDANAPNGTYPLEDGTVSGTPTETLGSTPDDPSNSVTISNSNNFTFDWSSTVGIDAVVVKAGNGANVYSYNPEDTGDTGLHSPLNGTDANDPGTIRTVSHVTFCYDPDPQPTTGTLKVVKELSPTDDGGTFDLLINGNVEKQDAGHGEMTEVVTVNTGDNTVGEASNDIGNYDVSIDCEDQNQQDVTATPAGNNTWTVNVGEDQNVVCTITNTRKTGTLKVVKELSPTDDGGTFDLLINGNVEKQDAGHGEMTEVVTVNTGDNTVGEASNDIGNYDVRISCQDQFGRKPVVRPDGDNTWTVRIGEDADVVCTITNTRKPPEPGELNVEKIVVGFPPDSDWNFTINGDAYPVAKEGGEVFADEVAPGEYVIIETKKPGYKATVEDCEGAVVRQNDQFISATVQVGSGDVVDCTFVNEAVGDIHIEKVLRGPLPRTPWEFVAFGPNGNPDVASSQHPFTLPANGGDKWLEDRPAGVYYIVEKARDGYRVEIQCEGNTADLSEQEKTRIENEVGPIGGGVKLILRPGAKIVCTFINILDPRGTVHIKKEVIGDSPDSDWDFVFWGPFENPLHPHNHGMFNFPPQGGEMSRENVPAGIYLVLEVQKELYNAEIVCRGKAKPIPKEELDQLVAYYEQETGEEVDHEFAGGALLYVEHDQAVGCIFYNKREGPAAIDLASFDIEPSYGQVTVLWETATETDNAGFNLYRATSPDGPWQQVNSRLIRAEGDAVNGASYVYTDQPGRGNFYYRLEDIDYYGVSTQHTPALIEMGPTIRAPWYRPNLPEFE